MVKKVLHVYAYTSKLIETLNQYQGGSMSKQMLLKAIEHSGGQMQLAKDVNEALSKMAQECDFQGESIPNYIHQRKVWNWLNRMKGPVPPAEYVIPIEIATGIPREKLRPDLYVKIEKTKAA